MKKIVNNTQSIKTESMISKKTNEDFNNQKPSVTDPNQISTTIIEKKISVNNKNRK
jgi:hypothetical protein